MFEIFRPVDGSVIFVTSNEIFASYLADMFKCDYSYKGEGWL